MSNAVKAEVAAVRGLKKGVSRYADQIRSSVTAARSEMAAAQAKAEDIARQRRGRLDRAEAELVAAQRALAAAPPEGKAAAAAAVAVAVGSVRVARESFDRARKACGILTDAASSLLKTLQASESVVTDQSSATASILASLDSRLSEITAGGITGAVRRGVTTLAVMGEIGTSGMGIGKTLGNVSQGYLPTAEHFTSLSEASESRTADEQSHWAENEKHRPERESASQPHDPRGKS